jgi:hypothetical protein
MDLEAFSSRQMADIVPGLQVPLAADKLEDTVAAIVASEAPAIARRQTEKVLAILS